VAAAQPNSLPAAFDFFALAPAVSDLWLGAVALMLVLEGLLPLTQPSAWRRVFERAMLMSDGQIRFLGLASVATGVVLLFVWH
jgi:uncharacterized protein